jgi:hypothetical protein
MVEVGPQVSPNVVRQHLESAYHIASYWLGGAGLQILATSSAAGQWQVSEAGGVPSCPGHGKQEVRTSLVGFQLQ